MSARDVMAEAIWLYEREIAGAPLPHPSWATFKANDPETAMIYETHAGSVDAALRAAGYAVVPEAELATLRAELAAAREALDFYACADHYPIHGAAEPDVVRNDGGRRARAALGDKP